MDSFDWKILSEIFLGIGIVLFIAAVILTIRYRVISNFISDLKVGKMSPEPFRTPSAITLSLRSTDAGLSAPPESDEDGPWTVVVALKQEETPTVQLWWAIRKALRETFQLQAIS